MKDLLGSGPLGQATAPHRAAADLRTDDAGPRREDAGPRREAAGPRREAAGPRREAAGPGPAAADPHQEAAELLAAVSAVRRGARQAVRRVWRAGPLPTAQIELLHLVAAQPGINVAAAARELRLAPNTVSTLVGQLAGQDLLRRERTQPDSRTVTLVVTDKARRRLADWRDLRAELTQHALATLTPEDRHTLAAATHALLRLSERLAMR